ncbi:hypothetical protein ACWV95_30555 [Streptomyces albus]
MADNRSVPPGRTPLSGRLTAALALLVLSPVCAEYLIGYDSIIGRPRELLTGLLLLAPLYGSVAVLIREAVRRTGRGWPSILLLSAAFGLIQAGLIDQSLFNPHFVDDASWARERQPTLVPAVGVSVHHLLGFVVGHVIWSFTAPVVVIESCVPRLADRPWLGRVGLTAMAVLYACAWWSSSTSTPGRSWRAPPSWASPGPSPPPSSPPRSSCRAVPRPPRVGCRRRGPSAAGPWSRWPSTSWCRPAGGGPCSTWWCSARAAVRCCAGRGAPAGAGATRSWPAARPSW